MNTNKIKDLRVLLGLSQAQLAKKLGLSQRDISLLENGKRDFVPQVIIHFLNNSGIDLNSFFREDLSLAYLSKNVDENEYPLDEKMNIQLNIHSKENDTPLGNKMTPHLTPHSQDKDTPLEENSVKGKKSVPYISSDKNIMAPGVGVPYYEMLPVSAGDITSFLHQAKPTSNIDLPQIKECDAVLPVYGSSMKGVIEPGDLIAVKEVKTRDEFDPAVPYMVITEEHRMVKYLRMDEIDPSVIWAESTNHAKIKLNTDSIKMVYAIKCVIRFF